MVVHRENEAKQAALAKKKFFLWCIMEILTLLLAFLQSACGPGIVIRWALL